MANRKITIQSTATIVETDVETENETQFDIMVATFEPNLFMIWQYLKMFNLNPEILIPIIKAIADIGSLHAMGKIIIEIKRDKRGFATIGRINLVDKTDELELPVFK